MSTVIRNRSNVQDVYPLSPLQEGILFDTVYAPGSGVYVTQIVWTLRGDLDARVLLQAWQRVVDRQPALRTCCVWEDQQRPIQLVLRRVSLPWEELDWTGRPAAEQEESLHLLLEADRERGFDLATPPLTRLTLVRFGEGLHRLVWTFHHLVIDGWSTHFVLREVLQVFAAICRGREPELAPVRPYRDYIAWLRQQDVKRAEAYWREALAGFQTPTPLDLDRRSGRGRLRPDRHRRVELHLDEAAAGSLRDLARRHRFTASALIHGAWGLLLSHYSGRSDILFGTVVSGRPAELSGSGEMIGMFINTLPVRLEVVPGLRLPEWLRRLQLQLARLHEVEHSPLVEVQGWSEVPRNLPLFESILTFESFETPVEIAGASRLVPGLEIEISGGADQTALPLSITARPRMVDFEYDPRRFTVEAIGRVRDDFTSLLQWISEGPEATLGELLGRLVSIDAERRIAAPTPETAPIVPASREGDLPLSQAQRRLWSLDRLERTGAGRAAFNLPLAWLLEGDLDRSFLISALGEVIRRHEVLRTVFPDRGGDPAQRILPASPMLLPVIDLSALAGAGCEAESKRITRRLALQPFDLENGPLLRLLLVRLAKERHLLAGAVHRIVADEPSGELLAAELAALYAAFAAGTGSPLPALQVQYVDFAVWQRDWLAGEELEERLTFWRRWLAGVPAALELPVDPSRLAVRGLRGGVVPVRLSAAAAATLASLAHQEDTTKLAVLMAGFAALLARYVRQEEGVLCTPASGRLSRELEPMIGPLSGPLPVRISWRGVSPGGPSFLDLIARVREALAEAQSHQEVPFEVVAEALGLEAGLSSSPLEKVSVAVREEPGSRPAGGVVVSPWRVEAGAARFDLALDWTASAAGLTGILEYTESFERVTVLRMGGHLERLLAGAGAAPQRLVVDLPLLSPWEAEQILKEWNDTRFQSGGPPSFQELFEAQVERVPDAVAAADPGRSLTYHELNRQANVLAWELRRKGVGIDDVVAIFAERSVTFLVGILGVLKAGAAYLPLEVSYPPERVRQIFAQSGARAALTTEAQAGLLASALEGLPSPSPAVLTLERAAEGMAANPPVRSLPGSLVYVIFTSGSTGTPKGAMLEHRGFLNHLLIMVRELGLGERDVVAETASQCFDISVWQFLAALVVGGKVVVLPDELTHDPVRLLNALEVEAVSVLEPVPSLLRAILDEMDRRKAKRPLLALRWIVPTGEALPPDLCRRWLEEHPSIPLLNAYGPTECSDDVTLEPIREVPPSGLPSVPIGRPLANLRLLVLDHDLQPVPIGVAGELLIGGMGVGRGYLNDPARTAEAFVPHPLTGESGGESGERLYRTGDLVRWLWNGRLDFLGRVDHQIKVRGFRIELGEVEAALLSHRGVREVVVVARGEGAERHLAGYVVAARAPELTLEPRDLRDFLAQRLPEYMVPTVLVRLDAMPLTPNGKIDRKALPAPTGEDASLGGLIAPRTPIEGVLAGIWSEVLALDRVGVTHSFFELGGHSLLAMRVISRVRQAFRTELPLQALFEEPTVAGLSRRVEQAMREGAGRVAPPVVPVPRAAELPLSFAQQRLWFIDQLEPDSPLYNVPTALRVAGRLDVRNLELAFTEMVGRHEALRTVFASSEGRPAQVIRPAAPFPLPLVDLAALPAPAGRRLAHAVMASEVLRPFSLSRGPLLRVTLLRLGEAEHMVLLVLHHIISDGGSMDLLIGEVARLYEAFSAGLRSPLPELPVQYADFAAWQRSWLSGEVLDEEIAYWRKRLSGMPPLLELPTDRPRPAVQTFRGAVQSFTLPMRLHSELGALARREGITLFMLLLAAFQVLLRRYSGQRDVSVGTPVSGRNRLELEGLIGFFVNTLVLRGDLRDENEALTFRHLLARVRSSMLEDYLHQEVPFERLVEELSPQRSLAYSPLFQVMFTLETAPRETRTLRGLKLSPLAVVPENAKFDLLLGMGEQKGEIAGALEYNTDLFDRVTAVRWIEHFAGLLASTALDADRPLADLELLTPAEKAQLLVEWNDMVAPAPRALLPELFVAQASRAPEAEALVAGGERLSYAELQKRAARIARGLISRGIGPEALVGVFLERTPALLASLLGILEAGAAYLPLDPAHPAERLGYILEQSGAAAVLTQGSLEDRLPAGVSVPRIRVDEEWLDGEQAWDFAPVPVSSENLAYVIYTSGSTGHPKGVAVTHRSVLALLAWSAGLFVREDLAGVLASTSICFDISVFELFAPLTRGGRIVLVEDALALAELEVASEVTLVNTVPSAMRELVRLGAVPSSVRTVNLAGEPLSRALAEAVYAVPGVERLFDLYGPSEDTVYSTWSRVGRGDAAEPLIGRPIANTRAYVMDAQLRPAPFGVNGELLLGGMGLARGYLNRPDLTAERFVPDPFGGAGERLYRTGDLVRWRRRGELEFLGRIDHQVKVRGFRIELGEIESVLTRHPAVGEGVVTVREDGGDRRLVAYVAGRGGLDLLELRSWLRERLPDYMIPATFVELPALPQTPNGKVDRKALPAPESSLDRGRGFLAPRTPTEGLLASIYADVLGVERVGALGHFFELGGHSLLATQVVSRLRRAFGVDLPLRRLFETPTVAGLAASVEAELRTGRGLGQPPLVRMQRDGLLPLSFAQQRLWFLDQLAPGSSAYNLPVTVRLDGALEAAALAASLAEVVRRHEALRTSFGEARGEPSQIIQPAPSWVLSVADLSGLPPALREEEARRRAALEAGRPFDLARGPLFRSLLLRLEDESHVVVATMHHVVSDGWSLELLMREVAALYQAAVEGRPSPLVELPLQYADFAAWQRGWLQGETLARRLGWWRERLAGAPPSLELPTDRPRPPLPSSRGAVEPVRLPAGLVAGLRDVARRHGATLFMTLLAGFQTLLSRYARSLDVSVGTPVAGRTHVEVEELIGFFVNTLVLRTDLSGDPEVGELLDRVREMALEAHLHQDVPFEKLVEELDPERSLSRSPLFQVMLALQNVPRRELTAAGLRMSPLEVEQVTAKFDLSLLVVEAETGELVGALEYATDLFDRVTMVRLLRHLERLLGGMAVDPAGRLSSHSLLGHEEEQQLLRQWNDTARSWPRESTLPLLFALQAERTPQAEALVWGHERLSYADLRERAERIAAGLRSLGVGPESLVGVLLERTPEMVASLLGVLQTGAAYVPLDPSYPSERIGYIVEESRASVVLSQSSLAGRLSADLAARRILLDGGWPAEVAAAPATVRVWPESLAYTIYTSGSTGRPKGVAISHRSAVAMLAWAAETFDPEELSGVLASTSITFDMSVFELFATLTLGGRAILARDALELPELPAVREVRLINTVPSAIRELVRLGAVPASVRTVNLGGEPLSRALVEAVYSASRVERVFNLYGPSEDTTYSTWSLVERGRAGEPSIGRQLSNTQAYVVDGDLRLVPGGVIGELLLGGAGLARGYLNRPELTAERFVPDPFGGGRGERVYRTGDLVRWRWTGELEYLGRMDHQVKVRGFRVELGEIEAALVSHPEVREGVVVVHGTDEARRLVAYAVAAEGALPVAELRAWLQRRLPDYMVPAVFVALSALPLSPNGKIDRKALPAPEAPREMVYLAPRTPSEEVVAAIFLDVLGAERVGALGHFFELGGHSLLAMQVVSRLRQAFQVELPLRRLFEAPTVAGLAAAVEAELRAGRGIEIPPLVPARRDGPLLPLSFAQQRLWFLDQLEPGSSLYNIPLALRVRGPLSLPALAWSLGEIARRHEALRTVFVAVDGSPAQGVHPAAAAPVPVVDLAGIPRALAEQLLLALAAAEAGAPFDLSRGPVLRTGAIRLGEEDHVILLTMHHIVSDGWSVGVLAREITALYPVAVSRGPSPLPELPIQYADYAGWQRGWLQGETLERELAYWREHLAGQTALELPTDRPRSAVRSQRGGAQAVRLSPDLALALQALGRREGSTLFMVLLAGFQTLLARLGGQEEISTGTPIAGRNHLELEGLIGFLVNTLVLRTVLAGDPEFRGLLGRVRESALGAYAHQDLPFERLVEEIDPARDPSRTPLFQAMFTLEEGIGGGRLALAGLEVERVALASRTAKFDLTLSLSLTAGGLEGALEYAQDLFDSTTIERWARHLGILLATAAARPEEKIADLPLLDEAARHQLVREWSSAADPGVSPACVHALFAAQAAATPGALAVVCGEERLTYRELDRRSNRLARSLAALGVTSETPVGLLLERSAALIVALLGVLKAGGAYLPLDPSFPVERLTLMLADAGAPLVLTRAGLAPGLSSRSGIRILSDWEAGDGGDGEAASPASGVTAGNLAYVIYTSGSTGRPKGVMVEHRQLVSYLLGMIGRLELTPGLSFALVQALTADAAKTTIYGALLTGGCLHVIPEKQAADAEVLGAYLESHDIDWLKLAPSHLAALWSSPRFARAAPRRYLVLGGEPSPRGWAEEILAGVPDCAVINQYGPTETTVGVLTYRARAGQLPPGSLILPLGRPLPGSRIHLLDRNLAPVPVGVAGELCIAGSGLARGYLGAPAQTAERFVPDPLGREPGGRLYRTGDLARSWPDGLLEFVGRLDHQIKIRGFRVELGEVEAALKAHPGLVDAVVVAREQAVGGRGLIAYVVAREPLDARRLREFLGDRLPAYMVPSAFVVLDELPRTPHGKVDRRALPDPQRVEPAGSVAPRTPLEELLAAIWGEVLGRERVGVEESFFELGGHSLLATQVMSRVRRTFEVDLPLRSLFEEPTVAAFAARVETELRTGRGLDAPPLSPVPRDGSALPLSFAQQRLWFLAQLDPESTAYNLPVAVRLAGPLDVAALGASLRGVVRRHEALRTIFVTVEGEPGQRIDTPGAAGLTLVDLAGLPAERREGEARRQASFEARRGFDLERGPLFRALLLRLAGDDHLVAATMHHIVSDGWSMEILVQEVAVLYEAFAAGRPSPLAELPAQYADFAVWQRQWLRGEALEAHLGWWRERLAGAPALLELPTDRPRPPVQSSRGAVEPVRLPAALAAGLRNVARRHGVTLFMVLLGGFQTLLSRYTRSLDVSVGTPTAGRTHVEIEGLIGFFVNTLVLRTDLSGDPELGDLLGRIRETALEAHLHQDVPFEKLVAELEPERSLSRTPLFQVMLALQNVPRRELTVADLRMLPLEVGGSTAKFDLSLSLVELEEELVGSVEYATDLFDRVSVVRLLAHLERLLGGMAADPVGRLSSCSLLGAGEQAQVTREWNDTEVSHPSVLLHERIAARALLAPDAVAVSCAGRELTYGELWRQADRLARALRSLGVSPEVRVGICMERSPELVVGLLGVLAAGGTYVPMDPEYPQARLLLLLEDSRASVVLTQARLVSRLPATAASLLILDAVLESSEIPDGPELKAGSLPLPANTAYVLFTSGSTGRPKGVMVPHRALAHHMLWMQSCYPLGEDDCVLQKTPIGFDASVWEFFAPLLAGGRLALAPAGEHRDPVRLVERLRAERVTVVQVVPALLKMLLEQPGFAACRDLRRVYCGGEALEERVKEKFRELLPEVALINVYGPTETTIQVSSQAFLPGEEHAVSIGRPIHNARLYVVDDRLEPLPIGVPGELLVGGRSLARGYLDRPDLTAERFLPDPFGEAAGGRLYGTGDLVRWRSTGELEYLGRIDQQVKVRGFRVELGEIEAVLGSHPAVRKGVVEVRGEGEERRLVAYAVAAEGSLPEAALRAWLLERLPDYMVPAVFVELAALPLSPSGKIDRKALPEPTLSEAADRFLAARTPVEEMVAGIWGEVLKVERPGVQTSFFDLGGHSLLATQVMSRVRRAFGVDLPLRSLFEEPTIAALAVRIEAELRTGRGLDVPPLPPAPRDGSPLPLSFAQQRLWFLDQLVPGSSAYNLPVTMRLAGRLDVSALAASLREVVRRHEALRTIFEAVDGEPMQRAQPAGGWRLAVSDLSGLSAERREEEARRQASLETGRPFDLARGPLLRGLLLKLSGEDHVVVVTMHHIVSDGWSLQLLIQEVSALYEAFAAGRPSPLAELPVQYADFAIWQRQWLRGEVLEAHLGWWRERLAGAPALLELPTDRPRPPVQSTRGSRRERPIPPGLAAAIADLARRRGATSFMALLTGFEVLLARYTGQRDVVVGVPIAGRNRIEVERLIGFFVNVLAVRTDLWGDTAFTAVLDRVRQTSLEAHLHQDLPFDRLVEELAPERSLSHSPIFQVTFASNNVPREARRLVDMAMEPFVAGGGSAKFDLSLAVADAGSDGLFAAVDYNTDLFDAVTVDRLLEHWEILLSGAVAEPERDVFDLPWLAAAEAGQVVAGWNATAVAHPLDTCVHELVAGHARRAPEALAVVRGGDRLTYGQLYQGACRLAAYLRTLGVGPETPVAVLADRSPEMVLGLLAVLAAGGCYVPLDPAYPGERLSFILADCGASVVLSQLHLSGRLPFSGPQVVHLDTGWHLFGGREAPPGSGVLAENLAYVIYTSGSTGLPKGVQVTHRSLANLVHWHRRTYAITAADQATQVAGLAFDAAVWELWPYLAMGACVHLPDEEIRESPRRLRDWLVSSGITMSFLPTPLAEGLLALDAWPAGALRALLTGGDRLHAAPPAGLPFELINHYGPTESTVVATVARVTSATGGEAPPIGRAIDNVRTYVVDDAQRPVPVGVAGELLLAGTGLARGYLNRPELTAERFLPDFLGTEPGARLYRTGDRARWRRDGELDFLGRVDQQVKVRGFRIEPGEIEAVLTSHPRLGEAVVTAWGEGAGRRLAAYVVPVEAGAPEPRELRAWLLERLPEYMVPSVFVPLPALPLTPNGKIDRRALPSPARGASAARGDVTPPGNPTELALVQLWEEMLDVRPIGIRDGFFELGGHSLLAVRLLDRIERDLGVRLPLTVLFQGATVEALAAAILRQSPPSGSPLVPLRTTGSRQPFFCVHAAGGDVFAYLDLARHLGPDQPFYGLRAAGLDGEDEPRTRVEEMAAAYVAAIRGAQPSGPYRIGGWSMGGVVAWEMARQLHEQGESVEKLLLIDSVVPGHPNARRTDEEALLISFVLDFGLSPESLGLPIDELLAPPPERRLEVLLERAKARSLVPQDVSPERLQSLFRVFAANALAMSRYTPRPGPWPVVLLRAAEPFAPASRREASVRGWLRHLFDRRGLSLERDPAAGWSRVASGGLGMHQVPGGHFTLVREPYVRSLAERMAGILTKETVHESDV
jgi:amino acid adenylation domain-containing protein